MTPRTPPTSDTGKRDVGILTRAWRWYRANRHGFRTPQHWQPVTVTWTGPMITAASMNQHIAEGIKDGMIISPADRRQRQLDAQRYAIYSERRRFARLTRMGARTFIVDSLGVTVVQT